MSYYEGDYYRGGFWSFLGRIGKAAVGTIPGVGPIASGAISALSRTGAAVAKMPGGAAVLKGGAAAGRAIVKHPVLSAAAAAGAVAGGASLASHRGVKGAAIAGGMRRHRRMRVTNPRALRRAIRRAHGFAKLAMRTIHLVHPRKKVRFGGFKRSRKK